MKLWSLLCLKLFHFQQNKKLTKYSSIIQKLLSHLAKKLFMSLTSRFNSHIHNCYFPFLLFINVNKNISQHSCQIYLMALNLLGKHQIEKQLYLFYHDWIVTVVGYGYKYVFRKINETVYENQLLIWKLQWKYFVIYFLTVCYIFFM